MCIKCPFCPAETLDEVTAASSDWTPGYWAGGQPTDWRDSPVCPDCAGEKLRVDSHGEVELIPLTDVADVVGIIERSKAGER